MFRYIAFVWNAADPHQSAAQRLLVRRLHVGSPGWQGSVDREGLRVFTIGARDASSRALPLAEGMGVVLGTLFERKSSRRMTHLGSAESARIAATSGRDLIESYWGRYVALLFDPATQVKRVLRDPTGGLPCLTCKYDDVDIYFSFIDDCVALGLVNLSINWGYLRTRLISLLLAPRQTAIEEVRELVPGECIETQRRATTSSFHWHPFTIAKSDILESPSEAASQLRTVAKASVHAWASCYDHILHRLSGGLDSSIVLACLQDAPSRPRVTCVNYYSSGANSDERYYARLAAARAGCELIEQERDSDVSLEGMVNIDRSAAPTSYIYSNSVARKDSGMALARMIGAGSMFGGGGGDQLFYQSHAALAAADYVCRHGRLGSDFIGIVLGAAALERISIWRTFGVVLRHGVFRRPPDLLGGGFQSRKLLNRDFVEAARLENRLRDPSSLHPWFSWNDFVPPGKLWHVYTLAVPQQFYNPAARTDDAELVTPLISQPLVELLLQVPTYVLTSGARDRALARFAFRDDVPREILRRRTKGGVEDNFKQVLTRNAAFIRQMLLDGTLVQERLLDRAKTEAALSGQPSEVVAVPGEIFDYLSIETWLRAWKTVPKAVAA